MHVSFSPYLQHSQDVRDLYSVVMEKIKSYTPEPVTPAEPIDSPLMSVPTPAPL